MKEIIDKILKGKFEYKHEPLRFSVPRVEKKIPVGGILEGTFVIEGALSSVVEGEVSTSEIRMEVLTPSFSGGSEEIGYRFSAEGLNAGDELSGYFRIISNCGEYQLPYVVTVEAPDINSSLCEIKNLFHFTNLARTNWDEAVSLFYSKDFIRLFTGTENQYESLYRGLSIDSANEQNVEEFLISINKKQKIEFIPDQKEIIVDDPLETREHTIIISKNGWGYTGLSADIDGEFISANKHTLRESDFLGNTCYFHFEIDVNKLHRGNNFGIITFSNAFTSFTVKVTVKSLSEASLIKSSYREKKLLTVDLMNLYIRFRSKKIDSRGWLLETGKLITRMNALDSKDLVFRLYNAHYLITAGRINEAIWILKQAEPDIEAMTSGRNTIYCYYLYLMTLCTKRESDISAAQLRVEGIYNRQQDNWRVAWLLQFLSDEYSSSKTAKWLMLEKESGLSCSSPIMYLDALVLLMQSPTLLSEFNEFTISTLIFAVRRNLLTALVIDQTVYLAAREKTYNKRLLLILKACYEVRPGGDCLEAICSMLIKGNCVSKDAFEWYKRGIDKQLRLTRLYEYYMMSIYVDNSGKLPCEISKMVLMYFSYQSTLDYHQNAILYKYLYENKDQYPELFESYRYQIDKFILDQISREHISRELGFLYQNMISRQMVDAVNAPKILSLINTSELVIDDFEAGGGTTCSITTAVVIYDKCSKEIKYKIDQESGRAFIPLYGSEYAILLEDSHGNRYRQTVAFHLEKLIIPGKLSLLVTPFTAQSEANTDLLLSELGKSAYIITVDNVTRYRQLVGSDIINEKTRSEIRGNLIRFYYDNDFERQLVEYLCEIDPNSIDGSERNDMLEMMVLTGIYDKAIEWLEHFGTYKVDPKIIVRLCSRVLNGNRYLDNEKVVDIAYYAFRKGKYDEELLLYLISTFKGTVREMRDLWKAAVSFGVEAWNMAEDILIQMLYSGAFIGDRIEIYRYYVDGGTNFDVEMAFLSQCCFENFVQEKVVDDFIFKRIAQICANTDNITDICRMDFLKFASENIDIQINGIDELTKRFVGELLSEKIYFPFFKDLADQVPSLVMFSDKTMMEYRSTPGAHCEIHYLITDSTEEENEEDRYSVEDMHEMSDGIFVSSFTLFFGEQLQYYVTEERETEPGNTASVVTQSGTLTRNDISQNSEGGRYNLINDIVISSALSDNDTVNRLLLDYYKKKAMTEDLFKAEF